MTVAAFGVLLNNGVVKAMIESMHLHYLVAQAVATMVVLGSGFVLNKIWTFAQRA